MFRRRSPAPFPTVRGDRRAVVANVVVVVVDFPLPHVTVALVPVLVPVLAPVPVRVPVAGSVVALVAEFDHLYRHQL